MRRFAVDHTGSEASAFARLDPRFLILTVLVYLLVLAAVNRHAVAALLPFALFPLHLVIIGHLPVAPLFWRSLAALPILLVMALPAPYFDARAVPFIGYEIAAGWFSGASLLIRGALAVTTALALAEILSLPRLGQGLKGLGAPGILVEMVMMILRYTSLLAAEMTRMTEAARARGLRGLPGPRVAVEMLSSLFVRSVARAERVHAALLARGYRGEMPAAPGSRAGLGDVAYAAGWILFFAVLHLDPVRILSARLFA